MFEHRKTRPWCLWRTLKFVVVVALGLAILGCVVMGLWNHLLPDLLGVKAIRFWQAVGLLVLVRLLFGGLHGFGLAHHLHRRHHMLQRWENMTPEEREKFRHGIRRHFNLTAEERERFRHGARRPFEP